MAQEQRYELTSKDKEAIRRLANSAASVEAMRGALEKAEAFCEDLKRESSEENPNWWGYTMASELLATIKKVLAAHPK